MRLKKISYDRIVFDDGTHLPIPDGVTVSKLPLGWCLSRGQVEVGMLHGESRWHIANRLRDWFDGYADQLAAQNGLPQLIGCKN